MDSPMFTSSSKGKQQKFENVPALVNRHSQPERF